MKLVKVLSGGAAAAVVKGLQATFESQQACTLEASFSAVGEMRERLLAGAPCDLLILTRPLITQLTDSGHILAGSAQSLGLVRTGVAVRAGTAYPAINNRQALAAALRAAHEIYYPDPQKATAGIHFMNVLKTMGLHEELAPALRAYPNGASAMEAMAQSVATQVIGCTQETEINYTKGVELVGSLPLEFELATDYTLGVCTGVQQPELAKALAQLLTGPASHALRRQGGFAF